MGSSQGLQPLQVELMVHARGHPDKVASMLDCLLVLGHFHFRRYFDDISKSRDNAGLGGMTAHQVNGSVFQGSARASKQTVGVGGQLRRHVARHTNFCSKWCGTVPLTLLLCVHGYLLSEEVTLLLFILSSARAAFEDGCCSGLPRPQLPKSSTNNTCVSFVCARAFGRTPELVHRPLAKVWGLSYWVGYGVQEVEDGGLSLDH